jgi:sugar (pentulose or hexulose) kinase
MQEAYIIIDIGTGNVRVAVAAKTGVILGVARPSARSTRRWPPPWA